MASAMTMKPDGFIKSRHSAYGPRISIEQKQVRIERSKSVAGSWVKSSDLESQQPDEIITAVAKCQSDGNNNRADDFLKRRESKLFLTSARRTSIPKTDICLENIKPPLEHLSKSPVSEVSTKQLSPAPLEADGLTEEELDAFYFDDSDSEPDTSKFDCKEYYKSTCNKDDLLPSTTFLRQMDQPKCNLSNLMMKERDIRPIAVVLVNNSKITDLNLSENDFGTQGIYHISEALRENVFITRVKLCRVGLDTVGMRYLQEGLRTNKTLTHLDLSANHLNANAAVPLAKLIQENDFIIELILRENDLDDKAGTILSSAISSNLTLKTLDLSWNHLRLKGAAHVVKAICENVELLEVDLSYNGLGEDGAMAFGANLHKNHTLRKLDITNTRLNFFNLGHFMKGLKNNDTLQVLKMTGNPFTTDGAIAILACLSTSTSSAINQLHLEDIPVNHQFLDVYEELKATRDICVHHKEPNRKKITAINKEKKLEDYDPLLLLFEFMRQEKIRLVDLFRTFDQNNDNYLTKKELKDGFLRFSMTLPEEKLESLMNKLDMDGNHALDFSELVSGKRTATCIRQSAENDKNGRMAENMNHLKKLVDKSRREKYEKHEVKMVKDKKMMRRTSSVLSISFPQDLVKTITGNGS